LRHPALHHEPVPVLDLRGRGQLRGVHGAQAREGVRPGRALSHGVLIGLDGLLGVEGSGPVAPRVLPVRTLEPGGWFGGLQHGKVEADRDRRNFSMEDMMSHRLLALVTLCAMLVALAAPARAADPKAAKEFFAKMITTAQAK